VPPALEGKQNRSLECEVREPEIIAVVVVVAAAVVSAVADV